MTPIPAPLQSTGGVASLHLTPSLSLFSFVFFCCSVLTGMSYVPRNHYLTLHDALRRLLGPKAHLAAFVKAKKPFQCDMLVNSVQTDPETLHRVGLTASSSTGATHSSSGSSPSSTNYAKKGVGIFVRELQELLGFCDVIPHSRRVDVVFRDRTMLSLALGADKADLPYHLDSGADINQEPDWRLRNRLRISLGFDEELFLAACSRTVNVAARVVEKSMYDYFRFSSMLNINPKLAAAFEASGRDWHAVLPPVIYWKAHGYALDQAYSCRHYQAAAATIEHVFADYYGEFPFDNPYCTGEDLNTIEVVQWLCEARKTGSLLTVGLDAATIEATAAEIALTTPCSASDIAGDGNSARK
jgi:hypothetical protein